MEWYEVVAYLLAAVGGSASIFRLVKALTDYRKGVVQRTAASTERLVAHLEKRIDSMGTRISWLEAAREVDGSYITVLVLEMAKNGIAAPPRPPLPEKS